MSWFKNRRRLYSINRLEGFNLLNKMLKLKQRMILAIAGVISGVFGIIFTIPLALQANCGIASLSSILIIIGLILLSIAFGD